MLISNAVLKPRKPLASYYSHLCMAPFHDAPDCSSWSLLSLSLPFPPYHTLWREPEASSGAALWQMSHSGQGGLPAGLGGELGGRCLQAELSHEGSPPDSQAATSGETVSQGRPAGRGAQSQSGLLTLRIVWKSRVCCFKTPNLKVICYAVRDNFGLPWWLSGKEIACNTGASGWIPGSGRSPGEGIGKPL